VVIANHSAISRTTYLQGKMHN